MRWRTRKRRETLKIAFRIAGPGKLSSLINPDPTLDHFFRVLSADERVVVVAPPAGLSLQEGVDALTGGIARRNSKAE